MTRKRLTVIISYFLVLVILMAGYVFCNHWVIKRLSAEVMVDQVAGIVVPHDENTGFYFDLKGFSRDGGYVLFVPTGTDISRITYYSIDENGKRNSRFVHDFSKGNDLIAGEIPVVLMQSQIPSMEVSLHGKSLEMIEDSKDHSVETYADVVLTCNTETAALKGFDTVAKAKGGRGKGPGNAIFKGRGNNTWEMDKKGYSISLQNSQNFLKLGETRNWVLLANAQDYSLIRNQVFMDLAKDLGVKYAGGIEPVDLFVDGEYRGSYSLAKRVEVGEASVNIRNGSDFLFRWGMPTDIAIDLDTKAFRHEESRVVEVLGKTSAAQKAQAVDIAQRIISEIEEESSSQFLEDVDLESFALYYWIQEFSKNTDSTSRSFYTVWSADTEKMYACPIWDMDRTVGVIEPFERPADYLYPTGYTVRQEEWFVPLFQHPEFVAEVERVYEDYNLKETFAAAVEEIPQKAEYIRTSAEMNFVRWPVLGEPQNNVIVKWMEESTFDSQVEWVRLWLEQRIDFFEENKS